MAQPNQHLQPTEVLALSVEDSPILRSRAVGLLAEYLVNDTN